MQKDLSRLLRDPNLIPSEERNLLLRVAAQAEALGMPCYVVGGFVRDLLLGAPINDFDIVVEGDAIQLGKSLVKKYGGDLAPHHKFHTAIWDIPSTFNVELSTLDLITARSESYSRPGALPIVKPSAIDDDLRRRDFTVNAMAIRLDGGHFGELLDPLDGQADLEKKITRVLHSRSFIDDPTRIFRAVRYAERYDFLLHPSSLALINPESLAVLQSISGERIRHEFDLIFAEEKSASMLARLGELGVFKRIHPELPAFNADYSNFLEMDARLDIPANRATMGYILWFMDLSQPSIFSLARRLNFTSDLTHAVWGASQLKKSLPFLVNSKPSVWVFALEKLPLLSIYAVYLATGEKALLDYLSFWRHVKAQTTGDDLKAFGLAPGPRYGEILTKLRAAWLDGEIDSFDEELRLLKLYMK